MGHFAVFPVCFDFQIFLAGKLRINQLMGPEVTLTEVLLGLTALKPLSGWTWTDGTPLQNYTKYFWKDHKLPPIPPPGEPPNSGNQCAAMTWIDDKIMRPRLRGYDCESGHAPFVCKLTPATKRGNIYVHKLANPGSDSELENVTDTRADTG